MIKDFRSISLHIGDLDVSTTEDDLLVFFKVLGEGVVTNVKVVREHTPANTSLRYGYVNFSDKSIAEKALEQLNYQEIKGKPCRLTWVQPDATQRRSQIGNLFIKPLPPEFKTRDLHDLFSSIGPVVSCKISPYKTEKAGVHGYVQFANKELADKAIEVFNGKEEKGVKLGVVPARAKTDIVHDAVFVKGFSTELNDDELQEAFNNVAPVKRAMIHRDKEKKSKQFGFVTFSSEEDATKAVTELNGKEIKGNQVAVSIARTKWEREQYKKKLRQKTRFLNLYVRGFPADYDNDKLRELFQEFGKITSCVIMKNEIGTSRGFGFCCFEKEEEARNAMSINGKEFDAGGTTLVVNYSQSQEERRAINVKRIQDLHLQQQQQHQQQQYPYSAGVGAGGVAAGAGGAGAGGVGVGLGYPYGYGGQAGLGYPGGAGVNAGVGVNPAYAPYGAPQGQLTPQQLAQRGGRQGGPQQQQYAAQQLQRQQQYVQQQQRYPQQGYPQQQRGVYGQPQYPQQQVAAGYAAAQGYPYQAVPGVYNQQQQQMLAQQQQQFAASQAAPAAAAPQQAGQAQQTSTTASVASVSGQSDSSINKSVVVDMSKLTQLSPDDQKQYLGELIYPRVHNVDADNAGKITGMLLELDVNELVHILEDRNELQAKILEAQNVLLQAVSQQQQQQTQ